MCTLPEHDEVDIGEYESHHKSCDGYGTRGTDEVTKGILCKVTHTRGVEGDTIVDDIRSLHTHHH